MASSGVFPYPIILPESMVVGWMIDMAELMLLKMRMCFTLRF